MNPLPDLLVASFSAQPARLRIAVVTETFPPEVNGVAMTLGRLVDGLIQKGHSVQLIRPRQENDDARPALNGIEQVLSPGVPVPTYGELRFGLPSKNRLLKLWRIKRPDVVHVATEGPLGWSAVAAARQLQLPLSSSFHTNFQSYSQHYGLSLLKTPIERYLRKLHNRTEATMVPTQALMTDLRRRGYRNVKLLSRGVDTELFSPEKRSQALRSQWGVAPDDLVVLLVGRLAKEKNLGLVITAFRAIQRLKPTARLVLVGDGPLRPSLQAACPDAVFTGVKKGEELATHYASSDVFLFASLTETYGNVVPEALASGLAVLSYANAAAQELIDSGVNGVLVPAGDAQQFVSAAVSLSACASSRQNLRQAAAPSVAHLRWEAIVDSFVGHLKQVIGQGCGSFQASTPEVAIEAVNRASA